MRTYINLCINNFEVAIPKNPYDLTRIKSKFSFYFCFLVISSGGTYDQSSFPLYLHFTFLHYTLYYI